MTSKMTPELEVTANRTSAQAWRIWAKALGEKSGTTNSEADQIALIRTVIVLCYVVTNIFIVAGIIRHW